jgi:hypothetical protein
VRASFKDAATLLRGEMGQMEGVMRKHGVDGEGIAAGLNVRFAGGWELWRGRGYTYKVREPRFNGQGDLVLGLEPEYEGSGKVMRNGNGNGHGNGVVPEVPVLSGENPGSGIKVAVLNALNGNKGGAPKVSPKVAPIGI